jgi:hypothetical protein
VAGQQRQGVGGDPILGGRSSGWVQVPGHGLQFLQHVDEVDDDVDAYAVEISLGGKHSRRAHGVAVRVAA